MKRLLMLAVLAVAACTTTGPGGAPVTVDDGNIRVYHDDQRGVTCWVYVLQGISCLADKTLGKP